MLYFFSVNPIADLKVGFKLLKLVYISKQILNMVPLSSIKFSVFFLDLIISVIFLVFSTACANGM